MRTPHRAAALAAVILVFCRDMIRVAGCSLLVVSGATALAQSPAPAASSIIVGRVIDVATSRPVPEAVVLLRRGSGHDATVIGRVIADAEGRYFFAGLAAGPYGVHASKVGYADGAYGVRRPPTFNSPNPGLVDLRLVGGQNVLDADIFLWKHASISGIVTDERGEPMAGIMVRPLQRTIVSGRPRFVGTLQWSTITDDRGMYRVSAMPPGHYVVSIEATQATLPAAVLAEQFDGPGGAARPGTLFDVSPELGQPGSSRNQRFGDHVLVTFHALPIPLVSLDGDRLSVYQTTYAPGVSSIGDAAVISLTAGEDRAGVSMQMRPLPAVRVSGRLVGPSGPLARHALRLTPATTGDLVPYSPFSSATTMSDAAGKFTFLGVPPGPHLLKIEVLPEGGPTAMRDLLWASQTVVAGNTDINDLVVTLRPAIPVNGRVILVPAPGTQAPGATPPALDVTVSLPQDLGPVAAYGARASTKGEFSTGLPGGAYHVNAQLPAGWFVKSIVVNDRTLGDSAFDAAGESLSITITATNAASRLTVTLRDGGDRSVRTFLFPADRSAWTGYGPATRRVQAVGGTPSMVQIFEGMPAGEYLVAAARDEFTADWPDPRLLEILSRFATRVTVREAQQQSVDIGVSVIR